MVAYDSSPSKTETPPANDLSCVISIISIQCSLAMDSRVSVQCGRWQYPCMQFPQRRVLMAHDRPIERMARIKPRAMFSTSSSACLRRAGKLIIAHRGKHSKHRPCQKKCSTERILVYDVTYWKWGWGTWTWEACTIPWVSFIQTPT